MGNCVITKAGGNTKLGASVYTYKESLGDNVDYSHNWTSTVEGKVLIFAMNKSSLVQEAINKPSIKVNGAITKVKSSVSTEYYFGSSNSAKNSSMTLALCDVKVNDIVNITVRTGSGYGAIYVEVIPCTMGKGNPQLIGTPLIYNLVLTKDFQGSGDIKVNGTINGITIPQNTIYYSYEGGKYIGKDYLISTAAREIYPYTISGTRENRTFTINGNTYTNTGDIYYPIQPWYIVSN